MPPTAPITKTVPNIMVWKPEDGSVVKGVLIGSTEIEFKKGEPEKLAVLQTDSGAVAIPTWYEFMETMKRIKKNLSVGRSVVELHYLGAVKGGQGTVNLLTVFVDGVQYASRDSELSDEMPF